MMKTFFLINAIFLFLTSCGFSPPETSSRELNSVEMQKLTRLLSEVIDENSPPLSGLWAMQTNYQQGMLSRINLQSLQIKNVEALMSDILLIPSTSEKFFALARMGTDSLAIYYSSAGKTEFTLTLPANFNAQGLAQDLQGQLWMVGLGSNHLLCWDTVKNESCANIDLTMLSDQDGSADLAVVKFIPPRTLVVGAQRINKSGAAWTPAPQSGLAVVDTVEKKLIQHSLVSVSNIVSILERPEGNYTLVGMGDLSDTNEHLKSSTLSVDFSNLSINPLLHSEQILKHGHILNATVGANKEEFLLVWDKENKKSCVIQNGVEIYCESNDKSGYVFSNFIVYKHLAVLAYQDMAKLKFINLKTLEAVDYPLSLPASSLIWGP